MNNRVIEYATLFSGVGGGELGIQRASDSLGIKSECVFSSEIDEYAKRIYQRNFGVMPHGDITKINARDVPDHDVLIFGFPCFPAGTPVMTGCGFVPIEKIKKNDIVLTHTGNYHRVINTMHRRYNGEMIYLDIPYGLSLECTDEHPFYVRDKIYTWNKERRNRDISYSEPYWLDAKDLKEGQFVGISIPTNRKLPTFDYNSNISGFRIDKRELNFENEDFWWCIGYYLAEGWYEKRRKRNGEWKSSSKIIVCANENAVKTAIEKFESVFDSVTVVKERTVFKLHMSHRGIHEFVSRLGNKAHEKRLPPEFAQLPDKYLKALLDGYIFGDGYVRNDGLITIATTSAQLARDVQWALTIYYKMVAQCRKNKTPDKTTIEGREVNQCDWYQVRIKPTRTKQTYNFYENGIIWVKIRSVEKREFNETGVYNIEVEHDHTYTVNGIIVHNCQAFSIAGKQRGFEDTRGTLFFEVARIAKEKQPKAIILENVRGLLSNKTNIPFEYAVELLNDEIVGGTLWVENFTPMNNWKIFVDCLTVYLREKLEQNLDLKKLKSDMCSNKNSESVLGKQDILVEHGLRKSLKFLVMQLLQIMKNQNVFQTEKLMQLECSEDDLILNLNQLYSIKNLKTMDISMLDTMVVMLGDLEKQLREYSEENLNETKLCITSMETKLTTDQKICMYVQDLNTMLFIVKQWRLSTNLWKKIMSNSTGKTDGTYYVKTFNIIIDTLRRIGYDVEWSLLNTRSYLPQNRERIYLVGHLRAARDDWQPVFPLTREGAGNDDIQRHEEGKRAWLPCLTTRYGERWVGEGYVKQRGPRIKRVHSLQARTATRPSLKYCSGGSGPLSKDDGTTYCIDTQNKQVRAMLTPDRLEKRQNGRRFKEPGEAMFTLTAQDIHGITYEDEEVTVMRKLTPIECERLQGFPDNWTAVGIEEDPKLNATLRKRFLTTYKKYAGSGKITTGELLIMTEWVDSLEDDEVPIPDSQRYKFLGNAMTTSVVQAVAEPLLRKWCSGEIYA